MGATHEPPPPNLVPWMLTCLAVSIIFFSAAIRADLASSKRRELQILMLLQPKAARDKDWCAS